VTSSPIYNWPMREPVLIGPRRIREFREAGVLVTGLSLIAVASFGHLSNRVLIVVGAAGFVASHYISNALLQVTKSKASPKRGSLTLDS
jgi:hypothetical protein